eukprot:m.980592 g.980592  ORF g.980592 m.980592 type:complete len:53 (-) comp23969_c0_seq6:7-165(-)
MASTAGTSGIWRKASTSSCTAAARTELSDRMYATLVRDLRFIQGFSHPLCAG